MRLDELSRQIEAELSGDGAVEVSSVATLAEAGAGQVSFIANPRYTEHFATTQASAVIVPAKGKAPGDGRIPLLKSQDPYYSLSRALVVLHGHRKHPHAGVHPKAHIEPTAGVGENTVIYPGCYIGPRVNIGRDCVIYPNVSIYEDCVLHDRVIVHAGTIIGSDGFGYATHNGVHHKIPQIGNVVIEDDVEIGGNCTIARGALESTRIGAGTKIDGLVMIGHGVQVGRGCILVAQVGISGSTTLGNYVVLAGQVGVAGHLTIGDQARVGAQAGVMIDVEEKADMHGSPAMPAQQARRVYSLFTKLPELAERIKQVEEQLKAKPQINADERGS
jgi:UDP-3-O-[3-hydroxymyristoyl] glucosamine N-acyltransferase